MTEDCLFTMRKGPKDWQEDYRCENGNYRKKCLTCGEIFYGHKRRMQCKECYEIEVAKRSQL